MKNFAILMLIWLAPIVTAQTNHFPNLKKLTIDKSMNVFVKYDPAKTQIIQRKLSELPANDPLYTTDEMLGEDVKVLETCLDAKCNERYILVFSYGPSADPTFIFYKKNDPETVVFASWGLQLYLTGNGMFYISGHTNNTFDMRMKFKLENDTIREVQQPYYYVGLKTKTKIPLTLYSDNTMKKVVAQLPKDYNIEVLLCDQSEEFKYLIKTEFGLLGWVKFDMVYNDDQIEGLYYSGD